MRTHAKSLARHVSFSFSFFLRASRDKENVLLGVRFWGRLATSCYCKRLCHLFQPLQAFLATELWNRWTSCWSGAQQRFLRLCFFFPFACGWLPIVFFFLRKSGAHRFRRRREGKWDDLTFCDVLLVVSVNTIHSWSSHFFFAFSLVDLVMYNTAFAFSLLRSSHYCWVSHQRQFLCVFHHIHALLLICGPELHEEQSETMSSLVVAHQRCYWCVWLFEWKVRVFIIIFFPLWLFFLRLLFSFFHPSRYIECLFSLILFHFPKEQKKKKQPSTSNWGRGSWSLKKKKKTPLFIVYCGACVCLDVCMFVRWDK